MSFHISQEDSGIFVALIGKIYFVLVRLNVLFTACETSLDIVEKALLGTVIISILGFKLGLQGFRGKPEYNVSPILTFDIQSLNCVHLKKRKIKSSEIKNDCLSMPYWKSVQSA